MNFRVKNAQISAFIIIGILLIIGAVFMFTLNWDSIPVFEDETSSFKIREFVESCLELESKEAVNLIGEHGGWLYHKNMIFTDRSKPKQVNKRAQGLDFLEKREIPYWYFFDDSSGSFRFNVPDYNEDTKYSIKNQIKIYIDENLEKNCIQSFRAFDKLYSIDYSPKEINSQVEFINEEIRVTLELPLEITEINTQNKEYIELFENDIYNEIRVPYHLAKDITLAEANSSFIEKRIMQFITPYQDSDSRDLLPPFYDFRITYDFRPWNLQNTIPLIEQIIASNINLIDFYSTDYTQRETPQGLEFSPFANSFNNIHTKDYLSETTDTKEENKRLFDEYKNYHVETTFIPKLFPSSISISPSSGDIILLPRPEAVVNIIPFFFTEYVAVYEMTLPILFEIESSNSQSDFIFNLALEANIDYNTPLAENKVLEVNPNEIGLDTGKSLICDPPQFISEFVSLNLTDPIVNGERYYDQKTRKFTRDETGVEDAIINFDCSGISTCFMGQTQIIDNKTNLQFRLPINCNPGTLEIYKFGHKRIVIENLNPNLNEVINLGEIAMPSERSFPLNIKLLGSKGSKYQEGTRLGNDEKGFLIFEHLEEEEATKVVEITKENQDKLNLSLLPGNYSIEGFVIYQKEFTIPEEEICYDTGIIFSNEECQTLPAIELKSWVRSGIEIDEFEISLSTILSREEITVNFVDFGVPNSYSSLQVLSESMGELDTLSEGFEPYFD